MAESFVFLPVSKALFCAFVLYGVLAQHVQAFEGLNGDDEVVLWKRGDKGVSEYRIPIITPMPDGSLLALSEGRKHSTSDSGPKYLALRKSLTSQATNWTDTVFIVDDKEAPDGLNLGSVIVDKVVNQVYVMYSFCYHKCEYATTYLIRSDDNGNTWTTPRNISQDLGGLKFAPGPGYGIQKTRDPWKGRLIICGHSFGKAEGMYCVVSDDHGISWKVAAALPRAGEFDPNECQMIEQDDGIVLLTARNEQHEECHCRMMAKSYDGCETFAHSDIYYDHTLIDPTVAASLLNWKSTVYFSNPHNVESRVNMTVKMSGDMGETWTGSRQIWKGPSGYSCLSGIPTRPGDDHYIGLVFEKGLVYPYESIVFVKIRV